MTSIGCDTTTDCPGAGCTSRRLVLAGGAFAAAGLLAGCGDSGSDAAGEPTTAASSAGGGTALGDASEVPVGSAVIFADEQVVVAQPTEGEYVAFSSTCTHQGCQVSEVTDGEIICTCHGSHFSIEDGAVLTGPATAPLEAKDVSVEGDEILLG